jgi:hypothetical protein
VGYRDLHAGAVGANRPMTDLVPMWSFGRRRSSTIGMVSSTRPGCVAKAEGDDAPAHGRSIVGRTMGSTPYMQVRKKRSTPAVTSPVEPSYVMWPM